MHNTIKQWFSFQGLKERFNDSRGFYMGGVGGRESYLLQPPYSPTAAAENQANKCLNWGSLAKKKKKKKSISCFSTCSSKFPKLFLPAGLSQRHCTVAGCSEASAAVWRDCLVSCTSAADTCVSSPFSSFLLCVYGDSSLLLQGHFFVVAVVSNANPAGSEMGAGAMWSNDICIDEPRGPPSFSLPAAFQRYNRVLKGGREKGGHKTGVVPNACRAVQIGNKPTKQTNSLKKWKKTMCDRLPTLLRVHCSISFQAVWEQGRGRLHGVLEEPFHVLQWHDEQQLREHRHGQGRTTIILTIILQ